MRGCAAISIDNNFTTRKTRIAIGAPDNESARWIYIKTFFRTHPAFGQNVFHERAYEGAHIVLRQAFVMLGRYHHRGGAHGLAIFIGQGDLAFAIGAEALHAA